MGKLTFVVEFEDGKEPPVSANLDVAGGRLVSVLFGDYRDDFFQPEEVDVVREALNELSVDNDDAHAEIIKKNGTANSLNYQLWCYHLRHREKIYNVKSKCFDFFSNCWLWFYCRSADLYCVGKNHQLRMELFY
ncbi:hypothetical protein [Escherichia coli]|uniref:hypothetical protein n=2 Tax=Escherichia coli TaxID=562 RepID=UPI00202F74C7|nr:hypothetical protein [Escherichia coli]